MKIYLIQHRNFSYDSYMGHVVVANSEDEVRQLVKNISADEGKDIWSVAIVEECGEYTSHRAEPFIIMSDFRSG